MTYLIRLVDNQEFPEEQRRILAQRYGQALVRQLGGSPEQLVRARRAWVRAKTRENEKTATCLSLDEKQAIVRWERAEGAARLLAFEGYTGSLEALDIEVRLPPAVLKSAPCGQLPAISGAPSEAVAPAPALLLVDQSHARQADLH